jgi:hypothetical protein
MRPSGRLDEDRGAPRHAVGVEGPLEPILQARIERQGRALVAERRDGAARRLVEGDLADADRQLGRGRRGLGEPLLGRGAGGSSAGARPRRGRAREDEASEHERARGHEP